MAEFALGTSDPPDNIETLDTALPIPRAPFREAAEQVIAASGRSYGRGYPSCQWIFSLLTGEQRAQLREFCPGASAGVYLTTLANDDEYHTYQAVMHWPAEESRDASKRRDRLELTVTFTHLVEVET